MKNNRYLESLTPIIHFRENNSWKYPYKILCASTDTGVILNNGKNGSRFAPKAIINVFKKLNHHLNLKDQEGIYVCDVADSQSELNDFSQAQLQSANLIQGHLCNEPDAKVVHLGGGHDHIYSLLMALDSCEHYDNIFILNIDAHCDTRTDDKHHSGTPFRNFDEDGEKPFHLIQYGIHPYANSKSTLSDLKRGSSEKFFYRDLYKLTQGFSEISKDLLKGCPFVLNDRSAIVLSLDCDGINGFQMPAVSAANSVGVSVDHVLDLIHHLRHMTGENFIFGIYEFNPVFDQPNQPAAKIISHLMYDYFLS